MGEGSTGAVGAVAAFTAGRGLSQNMQNTGRQVTDTVKSFKAHKEKEANQQLENVKGFNSISNDLDKNLGAGQGERISSILGINDKNSLSQNSQKNLGEFNRGAALAEKYAGEEGKEAFINAMEESAANGFSQHGDAAEAAKFHSQNIASNAMEAKAEEKFGSAASAYLHAVAPHKDGDPNLLDLDKGGKAISDLGKAHSMLGPEFQTVLSQAVANHADNPSAMNSFIAGHYNDAKMNAPVEQKEIANPVNDSHEGLPPVMDTPTFNPTTGEVEGGAVNSEPQQASLDFTPVNQATIDQFGAEQISVPNNEPPKISDGDINDV